MERIYDVVVPGGGLAGLCLAIQLKLAKPDISILILESREGDAPTGAHKVGESTVELATHYMREILNLKDYLEEFELPKQGLRFFFKTKNKNNIAERVELGPHKRLTVKSHQLDRGTLENHLAEKVKSLGAKIILGARAKNVEFSVDGHTLTYSKDGEDYKVMGKWIADATGRGNLLKRMLKFQKPMEHAVNAVWWRLKGKIDVNYWSDNSTWNTYLEPEIRYLATVHFMDKGYWVWVISLGSGNTSIGIVADPSVHPFEEINTYEKSLNWLEKNEPLCYEMLKPYAEGDGLMDFRVLKHFAHESGRFYSSDRWGVTGEAGAFLDPLYSSGSDFIAMNNTWLSDLIIRDLNGEDITLRANVYEQAHLSHLENWIPIYQNKYLLMGNTQIMLMKISWDWAIYWAVPCLLFTNNGLTNLSVTKQLFAADDSLGKQFGRLNKIMQNVFLQWAKFETAIFTNAYVDAFEVDILHTFQLELVKQHEPLELIEKVKANIAILEKLSAAMYRLISNQAHRTSLEMNVDPYAMSLDMDNIELHAKGLPYDATIAMDIDKLWLYNKNVEVHANE